MVSLDAATAMAERRVTVPAGGTAISSRELTTRSALGGSPAFDEHPPAASAKTNGMSQTIDRARFMSDSPFPSKALGRYRSSIGPPPGSFKLSRGFPCLLDKRLTHS